MHITTIDTEAAWQQIAGPWNELLQRSATPVPFLRFEFLKNWWATRGGGEWPDGELRIFIGRGDDGTLAAAAPLFSTSVRPGSLSFLGTSEIADYLDLLAPAELLDRFAASLLAEVDSRREVATLDLWNVLETSPTGTALARAAGDRGWSVRRERLKPCPLISLDGGWEGYLQRLDRKQRHELRRKMRRAAESPGVTFRTGSSGSNLDQDVQAFLELMALDREKLRFLTPAMRLMFQTLARDAARGGWLRLEFLEVDGRPAAAAFCFDERDRLLIYNSGMDPAFGALSPGWTLLGHLIQSAASDGKAAVDFLRGDEVYKSRLGGRVRYVERITLRAPS